MTNSHFHFFFVIEKAGKRKANELYNLDARFTDLKVKNLCWNALILMIKGAMLMIVSTKINSEDAPPNRKSQEKFRPRFI